MFHRKHGIRYTIEQRRTPPKQCNCRRTPRQKQEVVVSLDYFKNSSFSDDAAVWKNGRTLKQHAKKCVQLMEKIEVSTNKML